MAHSKILALVGQSHLTWKRHLQMGLVGEKITLKQLYVLNQLTKNQFLNPSEIAKMLYCDNPTATVVICNMEKYGWVIRQKDPANRRRVQVTITSQGKKKLRKVRILSKDDDPNAIDPLSCFSPAQKKQLENLLTTLHHHLVEATMDQ